MAVLTSGELAMDSATLRASASDWPHRDRDLDELGRTFAVRTT